MTNWYKQASNSWTKEEAEAYLHSVAPLWAKAGYTLKIVGSVAEKGESSNDLDILAIQTRFVTESDFELLDQLLGEGSHGLHYDGPNAEKSDGWVYPVTTVDGKVVDFFLTDPQNFGHE